MLFCILHMMNQAEEPNVVRHVLSGGRPSVSTAEQSSGLLTSKATKRRNRGGAMHLHPYDARMHAWYAASPTQRAQVKNQVELA